MPLLLLLAATLAAAQPAAPPPPAAAASAPAQLDRVEVRSGPTAASRRRASTASKIVIDREELQRLGDTQLGDVLRRLPGITLGGRPGRGGDIRMRGMGGGFTQILIDGDRAPAGFAVEDLPPEQVERIEIYRAPTAETGARAVAGTLNIILREPLAKAGHELRASLGGDHGQPQGDFAWTRNLAPSPELAGALTVNGAHSRRFNDIALLSRSVYSDTGSLRGESAQLGGGLARSSSLNSHARLRWKLSDQFTVNLSPVLFLTSGRGQSEIATRGFSRFDAATGRSESSSALGRLNLSAQWRPQPGESWELRGGLGRTRSAADSVRLETLAGAFSREQNDHTRTDDRNTTLGGKWSLRTSREHQWVSGWEWEAGEREQTRQTLENGAPKAGFEDFGDSLAARSRRVAAYTQDEWAPSPAWSVYAGLRWEQIETRGDAGGVLAASRSVSRVASPLFHVLYKPPGLPKDQVRLSLTRSYRAPSLNDLIARPVLTASYPSGPNPQTSPDRAGNPALRPELASGIDLSLEHWLDTGGVVSASAFMREIDGLIRQLLAQEQVPWDAAPRWVSRPRNLDRARSMGVELELKARLDELWDDAPDAWAGLMLRANLAVFHSQVDGIPGPDNRLEQQPRGTLNLGADHRWRFEDWSLSTGFNFGFVPGGHLQQTPILQRDDNPRRVLDAYLGWRSGAVRDGVQWRLSVANLVPYETEVVTQVDSAGISSRTTDRKRTFSVWSLRAETRF